MLYKTTVLPQWQKNGDVVRFNGGGFPSSLESSLLSFSKSSICAIYQWIFRFSIADHHSQDITCLISLSSVSYLFCLFIEILL